MEGFKNNNDGLDYVCEICMDRPGGCKACGYGNRQTRQNEEEKCDPFEDKRLATSEDIDDLIQSIKGISK